jgi:hypothetical protein
LEVLPVWKALLEELLQDCLRVDPRRFEEVLWVFFLRLEWLDRRMLEADVGKVMESALRFELRIEVLVNVCKLLAS